MNIHFKNILDWKNKFLRHEQAVITTEGTCSIYITAKTFSLAYLHPEKENNNLVLCAAYPYSTPIELETALSTLVKYHQLEGVNCIWVLQPEQYQFLLMDALPVPNSEFQAAIRWKIKDLLRFPIDDVVIDKIEMPLKKIAASQDMMMVAAAKASELITISGQLQKCGLNINTIDILELALRNVSILFDQEEKSTALIYLQSKNSQLIITSKKQLYFARRIDLGCEWLLPKQEGDVITEVDLAQKMDKLALEIQRSFDYYQSQWRQPAPARMLIGMEKSTTMDLSAQLTQRLSLPVEILNVNEFFSKKTQLSIQDQGQFLPIIGGVLRREGEANVSAN